LPRNTRKKVGSVSHKKAQKCTKRNSGQRRVETTKCTNNTKDEAGREGHKRGPGIRTKVNKENEGAETGIEKNDYDGNWKDRRWRPTTHLRQRWGKGAEGTRLFRVSFSPGTAWKRSYHPYHPCQVNVCRGFVRVERRTTCRTGRTTRRVLVRGAVETGVTKSGRGMMVSEKARGRGDGCDSEVGVRLCAQLASGHPATWAG
jgi:hypothetical protein